MKPLFALLFLLPPFALLAQTPPPAPAAAAEPDADAVLATAGGKTITYGDLKGFISVMQLQPAAMRDRKTLVSQYALLTKLAEMAEKAKLYEESPTKEILRAQRAYIMAQAQMSAAFSGITVSDEDARKFYENSKDRYTQARVKVIYISFNPGSAAASAPAGKKYLTETEAKAKAEKILAELRHGGDFVKLVKQHSEDQTSAAKDGDFGFIRRTDNLPEAIRSAVFALKPGEISEPVRQPNGYYLFRVEGIAVQPFDQVQQEIGTQLKQARFKQFMDGVQGGLNIKFEDSPFFNAPGAAPAPPAPAVSAPKPAK